MSNLLFICSKNQWRSPTAEVLFKNHAVHNAKSAGTGKKARIKVTEKLLLWADVVFVMERRHKQLVKEHFPLTLVSKELIVLDIEDDYGFGDSKLIEILTEKLSDYL